MKKNTYFAYRSFWPEPEAHRRFNRIGVDTVCFFAANTVNSLGEPYCKYPPIWVAAEKYDFAPFDAQMADLIRDSPNAKFICMVDLNTPQWFSANWLKMDAFNQFGRLCSDSEWRRITAQYLRNFLLYAETCYPGQISAYVLSCGCTSEWYDKSMLVESESRCVSWCEKLEKEGLPAKDIPGLLARNHVSFDGLLRDPNVDGESLKYIGFCAEQVVDTIKFFLQKARETICAKTELGVFFGYPLALSGWGVIVGNNDCAELLKCPELDFVIAPIGGFSKIGQGGGDLGPTESVQLHGKRYLRECDQRTHTFNNMLSKHTTIQWPNLWTNEAETLAGIKRELAYTLIKQCSLWWFDMWGGFYDSPAVMELLANSRKIYSDNIDTQVEKTAEIALIVDPESIYYLNQNDNRVKWFYRYTKRKLDLIGAPYECYNFADIPDIPNRDRIKLWLLPAIFEVTLEKQKILDSYVRREGKASLYMYAPGISDGKSLDPQRIKRLTGSAFGSPGVNISKINGHLSAYVDSAPI